MTSYSTGIGIAKNRKEFQKHTNVRPIRASRTTSTLFTSKKLKSSRRRSCLFGNGLAMSATLWNRKSLIFTFLNFVSKSNCYPTYANKTFFSRDFATFGRHLFISNLSHNRDNVPRQILITLVSTKMLTWIRLADMISYELALSLWIRSCCDWCFVTSDRNRIHCFCFFDGDIFLKFRVLRKQFLQLQKNKLKNAQPYFIFLTQRSGTKVVLPPRKSSQVNKKIESYIQRL